MKFRDIQVEVEQLGPVTFLGWCDEAAFERENQEEVAPGGYLNPEGWFVVGVTVGGNAVVVSLKEPGVYFADHSWYYDEGVSYQDYASGGEWVDLPLTAASIRRSLYQLADSWEDLRAKIASGELAKTMARIA